MAAPQTPQEVESAKKVLNDYSAKACGKHVTVYCWSSTATDSERWQQAQTLGAALAAKGFGIVTGGYCGSMEAVSKGARESSPASGAETTPAKPLPGAFPTSTHAAHDVPVRGILVPGQFPDRVLKGNDYVTESIATPSLMSRLDVLSALTRYYVALPGTLGTLTEISIIWSLSVLHKRGAPKPLIICFRDPWQRALEGVGAALAIPQEHMAAITYVDTIEECVALIEADYAAETARTEG